MSNCFNTKMSHESRINKKAITLKIRFIIAVSDVSAIIKASNYPDLLPEMPRYCGLVKTFY